MASLVTVDDIFLLGVPGGEGVGEPHLPLAEWVGLEEEDEDVLVLLTYGESLNLNGVLLDGKTGADRGGSGDVDDAGLPPNFCANWLTLPPVLMGSVEMK